jgi:hypothetical protein
MIKKALVSALLVLSAGHALADNVLSGLPSLRMEFYSDSDDKKVGSVVTKDFATPTNSSTSMTRDGTSWNSDYVSKAVAGADKLSYGLTFPSGSPLAHTTLDVSADYKSGSTWKSANTIEDINVTWGGLGVAHNLEEIDKNDRLTLAFGSKVKLSNILLTEHYSSYDKTPLNFGISIDGGAMQTFSGKFVKVGDHSELALNQSFVGKSFQIFNTYTGSDTTHQFYLGAATVAAVPEPESYAMLLAGLGLMGGIARRRKNSAK